jgi:hypothetical protein
MGAFENFPYTNFHELNLNWILDRIQQMTKDWSRISEYLQDLDQITEEVIQEKMDEILGKIDFQASSMPVLIGETPLWNGYRMQGCCMKGDDTVIFYIMNDDANPGYIYVYNINTGEYINRYQVSLIHGNDLTYAAERDEIFAVDGNSDTIFVLNASTYAIKYTRHISGYLPHGISWSDGKLYTYSISAGVVVFLEVDPDLFTVTEICRSNVGDGNLHQGMCADGDYFYVIGKDPSCVVRFDRQGGCIVGDPIYHTRDGYYMGEMQSIDKRGSSFMVCGNYTDYTNYNPDTQEGNYVGKVIYQAGWQSNRRKPRVMVFAEWDPKGIMGDKEADEHPSSDVENFNCYISFDHPAWHPTGVGNAGAFATLLEAQAFDWRYKTVNFYMQDVPVWADAPEKFYVPVLCKDNSIITVRGATKLLVYGCSNVQVVADKVAVDLCISHSNIYRNTDSDNIGSFSNVQADATSVDRHA